MLAFAEPLGNKVSVFTSISASMMRPISSELIATFRRSVELAFAIERIAAETGYSKSKIIREVLDGAILRLEAQAETRHDLVLALNRFSRMK
jgi:hypothetical protein